jgi:hypothetical protein
MKLCRRQPCNTARSMREVLVNPSARQRRHLGSAAAPSSHRRPAVSQTHRLPFRFIKFPSCRCARIRISNASASRLLFFACRAYAFSAAAPLRNSFTSSTDFASDTARHAARTEPTHHHPQQPPSLDKIPNPNAQTSADIPRQNHPDKTSVDRIPIHNPTRDGPR